MRKTIPLAFTLLFVAAITDAQNLGWKAGLDYFFDNTEYARSTLTKDQTMTGVHFSPEAVLSWDSVHHLSAGVDLLKTAGSVNMLDAVRPVAYYQYKTASTNFYAGAFPRSAVLSNYSDLFFQDSVAYYRPTLEGIFWQRGNAEGFFNLWLDWNGHQTAINHETFFVGASAHKKWGHAFTDFQSYLFHFANTNPPVPGFHVCDNALAHWSAGFDYSNQTGLDTLLVAAGVLAGFERERNIPNSTYLPVGIVVRANVDYSGFGVQNTLYAGNPRQLIYGKYGNELYWNNPFLRAGFYLQSKWYLQVIRNRFATGRLNLNLHFSEGRMMYEQVFTLRATLSSDRKNATSPKKTLLAKIFN
ncbi:MAG TPA: hypothetical protein VK152_04810 [Paludibacter sp.]|nr:hypothetical protein [Paludibacter sp.]